MSVLKSKRQTSRLEFLHNAYKLRRNITDLLLRDFGVKEKVRTTELYTRINRMSKEDTEKFLEIVDKYKIRTIVDEYPEWLISDMRNRVMSELRFLIRNIIQANTIYPTSFAEFTDRRRYQNRAIGCCEQILQELQYVLSVIDVNVNKYMPYVKAIEKEIALLRGWRKSDNRLLKKVYTQEVRKEIEFERLEQKIREEYDDNNQHRSSKESKTDKKSSKSGKTNKQNQARNSKKFAKSSFKDRFLEQYVRMQEEMNDDPDTEFMSSVTVDTSKSDVSERELQMKLFPFRVTYT